MAAARDSFGIFPLGDSAVLAEFGTSLDLEVNARLQRLAEAVRTKRVPWISDIVPALGSLALHFDPARLPPGLDPVEAAQALLQDCLRGGPRALRAPPASLEVLVCYDDELGPDLAEVAEQVKLSADEVVRRARAGVCRALGYRSSCRAWPGRCR